MTTFNFEVADVIGLTHAVGVVESITGVQQGHKGVHIREEPDSDLADFAIDFMPDIKETSRGGTRGAMRGTRRGGF